MSANNLRFLSIFPGVKSVEVLIHYLLCDFEFIRTDIDFPLSLCYNNLRSSEGTYFFEYIAG